MSPRFAMSRFPGRRAVLTPSNLLAISEPPSRRAPIYRLCVNVSSVGTLLFCILHQQSESMQSRAVDDAGAPIVFFRHTRRPKVKDCALHPSGQPDRLPKQQRPERISQCMLEIARRHRFGQCPDLMSPGECRGY
jgi:hypothetical protein